MSYFSAARILAVCLFLCGGLSSAAEIPEIELVRVPDGGIQPQTVVDQSGTVHLLYFKGDPAAGDLFYSHSDDGRTFSESIRVNSIPGSAVAIGNIRGGRIALGRGGRVYAVWNGSRKAQAQFSSRPTLVPMLFARLNGGATSFEPQRNLIHTAYGIDGGGGIAADRSGRVYVFWHAPLPNKQGEQYRRVWMTRSTDDGTTFEPEQVAWDGPVGACGCCSLNAASDSKDGVYVLFRSARETVHRDMYLLQSNDHGASFAASEISGWNVAYCVMSSEALVHQGSHAMFGAWETARQVHFGVLQSGHATVADRVVPQDSLPQKFPSLATNNHGTVLVAWTEGMAWNRGGSVRWQLFDSSGSRSLSAPGTAEGVPAWSLVSAFARRDGGFAILY